MNQFPIKQFLTLSIILILLHTITFGQGNVTSATNKKITKNLIFFDYGAGYFGAQAALNYERTIFYTKGSNISLKGAYGLYSYFIPFGDFYSISGHYSYGKRHINLETAIGISFQDWEGSIKPLKFKDVQPFPLVYLGCKLKKPTDQTVIKLGVGYPQLLSFGLGVAF